MEQTGVGWGVFQFWRFEVREVIKLTAQMVTYREARGRDRKAWRDKMAVLLADKAAADKLAARLNSAKAEQDRREAAARIWFAKEKDKLIAASGITAETPTP